MAIVISLVSDIVVFFQLQGAIEYIIREGSFNIWKNTPSYLKNSTEIVFIKKYIDFVEKNKIAWWWDRIGIYINKDIESKIPEMKELLNEAKNGSRR